MGEIPNWAAEADALFVLTEDLLCEAKGLLIGVDSTEAGGALGGGGIM